MSISRVTRFCCVLTLTMLAACSSGPSPEEVARLTVAARIGTIEQRKSLIEDANAIERLQHAYGYYFDRGLWDDVANLFADDGTIEIGLDGVYVGKERVREYLYALGGGRQGLPAGKLNEYLQVMPVITVARDGLSAKARWRAIALTGQHGGEAFWGEGPYENEYVKDGGVWKIKSLHWYQALHVPYEKGWQTAPDPTGGKHVSATLPPDRPPSVDYKTWPDTYVPPFSFPNPVGKYEANESPAASASPVRDTVHLGAVTNASFEAPSLETLAARAAALERDTTTLEDVNAIKRLQRIYGFYTDKQLWTAAADLFAAGGTIEVGGGGVYVGRERVLEFLRTNGPEFPQPKRLFDHMQLQPIVTVAADGLTAKGRWHVFAQEAVHGEYANWGLGVLENEYVKEDGTWTISREHFFTTMYTPYEAGWGKQAIPNPGPSAELPPDRPPSVEYEAYPAAFVVPFHYENPVTGTRAESVAPTPTSGADIATVEAGLADLERRVGLLEDITQLERMNSIYGYYLAHLQWDDLAGIFAPDGTIEIAMRGVYAGQASVRRNLNLYGLATDPQFGLQHNHMQFQPVITLAPDGQSALMRSRALSIMGQWERYSQWMGGIYENEYVKENGVWKIKRDQVFNTYFVPYLVGWKDAQPRPPPGITASNPPDAPPTHPFEMYPSAFLPPFHYVNPVTGQPVMGASQ